MRLAQPLVAGARLQHLWPHCSPAFLFLLCHAKARRRTSAVRHALAVEGQRCMLKLLSDNEHFCSNVTPSWQPRPMLLPALAVYDNKQEPSVVNLALH